MSRPARPVPRAAWLLPALVLLGACTPQPGGAPGATTSPRTATPTASPTLTTTPPSPDATAPSTPQQSAPPGAQPAPGATSAPPADPRKRTTLVVTFGAWNSASGAVEVSGYVPLVEGDGTCTLTLTQGASTVTARSTAYPDASSTSCDLLSVPRASLGPGSWQASVDYASSTSLATSTPLIIEVP
ncbi:hypothetical protein [Cellulomonas sp.]|uniref:hypothetical protein n=1 Tax=Cellulomonas sp. TaxID=40001 RepID=UPI001B162D15|nr:hypothetical protein [Cellulomonas sp.]MBO9555488.1 hypothetical protein [Cellulomonas sp.]